VTDDSAATNHAQGVLTFDALTPGTMVTGLAASGAAEILAVDMHGSTAASVTWTDSEGRLDRRVIYGDVLTSLRITQNARRWAFSALGDDFLLASEARRLRLAYLFDPMLAVTTSAVRPLPHQIRAVYGEMLPRQPLRFILADDPGAGKTIMAGLLVKELMLRGDLKRCLIVAPGSLVEQWQRELGEKFGVEFSILTRDMIEASRLGNPFAERNLWIARLDHLSRDPELSDKAAEIDWDIVIVDEAHKMSARVWSGEVKKTKRYELGEKLGAHTRHLLLMTATPHSGKEEDFQLFLGLVDSDRFIGRPRDGARAVDVSDLMRRMVKEELLTFEGTRLFPERRSYTVEYQLSPEEELLYAEVTEYVREEMNRADRLETGQGRKRIAVGFALTTLQRRLASSPEAIYQSLVRRQRRLERQLSEANLTSRVERLRDIPLDDEDYEDLPDDEREELEDRLVSEVSTAETVAELQAEILTLKRLVQRAQAVRVSGNDTKWKQFSALLDDTAEMRDASGNRRKLIVFTEHKDTLHYLTDRLRTMLGRDEAVVTIHGGTRREERRAVEERFRQDADCTFLVATDAAGEGVNLQRAHLLVNYDLPWNPNRIEQRFGRVHRIGQTEVCHMWNLLAKDTREGDVFVRLLEKLEQERKALGGRVYDVLGQVFEDVSLKDLLMNAIREGDKPEVRARLFEVVDATVGQGLKDVLDRQALDKSMMSLADVAEIRRQMERAEANRLQPHYIQAFFEEAFGRLGGRLTPREPGRFEIKNVPVLIRDRDRDIGGGSNPVVKSYQRVTFERDLQRLQGVPEAALIAPGHPLFDAVLDLSLERLGPVLTTGSVLVNDNDPSTDPYALVYLEHEIEDGRPTRTGQHTVISRQMQFVAIGPDGRTQEMGGAPFLDCRPATEDEQVAAADALNAPWLVGDQVERTAVEHAITTTVATHLAEVRDQVIARVDRTEQHVRQRLTAEIRYWDRRSQDLREQEAAGKQPKMNADAAQRRADDLAARLQRRLDELARERQVAARPPVVAGACLVLPAGFFSGQETADAAMHARETQRIERIAVDAVLAVEHRLGHEPTEMAHNNPGYDIESVNGDHLDFIEVKGRVAGADSVHITKTEILTALNKQQHSVLAMVMVHDDDRTEVRYLRQPFGSADQPAFGVACVIYDWQPLWDRADTI
jgi:superfamily II DNA or RNA helicase